MHRFLYDFFHEQQDQHGLEIVYYRICTETNDPILSSYRRHYPVDCSPFQFWQGCVISDVSQDFVDRGKNFHSKSNQTSGMRQAFVAAWQDMILGLCPYIFADDESSCSYDEISVCTLCTDKASLLCVFSHVPQGLV